MMEIGKAIRAARVRAGYSQFGLSYLVGNMPRTFLSKIESGRCMPNLRTITRICAVLEIEPWVLIRDASTIESNPIPQNICPSSDAMSSSV